LNFKLQFRQGSFRREFHCASLDEAIRMGGAMSGAAGCLDFQIVNDAGIQVLDQTQILERFETLTVASPEPPRAA
jgi:hypothetical protein